MDLVNVQHKVSCWKSVNEFLEIKNLIFNNASPSNEDKKKALDVLRTWKIRRGQDAPLGVLCTIVLLDVSVKDSANGITDKSIMNTLYASALTKFINFATSFQLGKDTMYASANQLGIDSFLIDLRHSFAHGQQTFNLDVCRHSHSICMKWIKEYYWDRAINNIQDVDIKDIRYDASLEEKLDQIFTFYDLLAELILKSYKTFDELHNSDEMPTDRWPLVKQFMKDKNLKNFRKAFKYFTQILSKILKSKDMRFSPKTFFHVMLIKCDLFMRATEMTRETVYHVEEQSSDDESYEITPIKRPKKPMHESVVNIYQHLLWHIASNDYLKLLLDILLQIYMNKGETEIHRKSAKFWFEIIIKSYGYYKEYYKFTKIDIMAQTKISNEIRSIYSYQLDADLKNVVIFVGTQMLPTTIKYSTESFLHLLKTVDENDDDLSLCQILMPLIYPPVTDEQLENMKNLIDIKLNNSSKKAGKAKCDEIFTVQDLQDCPKNTINDVEKIWKLSDSEVSWSSLPLGHEFKV